MVTSMFEELNQNRVSQFLKCGIFSLVLLCAGTNAQATLQTIGAGTAVSVPADRTMTFDSLTNGTSLATYSEDSMTILYDGFASSQGNTTHPGFTPFHGQNFLYSGGGSHGTLKIQTSDGLDAKGLEFVIGTGFGGSLPLQVHAAWEAYRDSTLIGSGVFSALVGDVIGFSDDIGFDEIWIDTDSSPLTGISDATNTNAIAIDDVLVGFTVADTPVPEPGTYLVFGLGLIGLTVLRRRRMKPDA